MKAFIFGNQESIIQQANQVISDYLKIHPRTNYYKVTLSGEHCGHESVSYRPLDDEDVKQFLETGEGESLIDQMSPLGCEGCDTISLDTNHPTHFTDVLVTRQVHLQGQVSWESVKMCVPMSDEEFREMMLILMSNHSMVSMNHFIMWMPEFMGKAVEYLNNILFNEFVTDEAFIIDFQEMKKLSKELAKQVTLWYSPES